MVEGVPAGGRADRQTDLWSDVVWCTTERPCCSVAEDAFFAHSKVSDLDMSFSVEHHVVQLEISVHKQPVGYPITRLDDIWTSSCTKLYFLPFPTFFAPHCSFAP